MQSINLINLCNLVFVCAIVTNEYDIAAVYMKTNTYRDIGYASNKSTTFPSVQSPIVYIQREQVLTI